MKIHIVKSHHESAFFWGWGRLGLIFLYHLFFSSLYSGLWTKSPTDPTYNEIIVESSLDLCQITHRPAKWLLPRKKKFLHLFLAVEKVRPILHCIGERDSAETVSCPVETVKIKKCNFLLGSDRSVITAGSSSLESVKKAPRHW